MKETYIQSIHVNKLFHLHDFDIRIGDEGQAKKHLIITGANGTGKTLLLNAIADSLENIATDKASILSFMKRLADYQLDPSPDNKHLVEEELDHSAPILGFKYSVIKSNPNLWNTFSDCCKWS